MTLIQPETIPTKGVGKYFNLLALNFKNVFKIQTGKLLNNKKKV